MGLPDVKINLTNGNLGREVAEKDGVAALIVSGIAVAEKFALGDILGPFYKPEDAEAMGIDADYDDTNKLLAYRQIYDFYKNAGNGADLYVMVVAQTLTMEDMCDKTLTHAAKLIEQLNGEVRLIGISRVPDATYTPTYTDGMDDDVIAAVTKAQALAEESFTKHRPVSFLIEGREFQSNSGNLQDLRDEATGPNANRVGVILSSDPDVSALETEYDGYANVGFVLGRQAAIPVQRNLGRVHDGKLPVDKAGFSDGKEISEYDETDFDAMEDKGYIFMRQHTGKAGYYFNGDHAACKIQDDYAFLSRGRTIDKAARLIRQVYLEDLLDEILVDQDGKLQVGVVKNFQARGKSQIEINMLTKLEISGCGVFVDPDQDILSTDKLEIEVSITPVGIAKEIVVKLGFYNPAKTS